MSDYIWGITMRNKFLINIKYGLVAHNYQILILIILSFFIGFIVAYNQSINFHNWYVWYLANAAHPSQSQINLMKIGNVSDFWRNMVSYMAFLLVPISSIIMSQYEENQMNQYLLLYNQSRHSLYLSRIFILFVLSFLTSLVIWILYGILFIYINSFSVWYPTVFFASFMVYFIMAMIGGIVGTIFKKRTWSIVISIFIIIFLFTVGSNAYYHGLDIVSKINNIHTVTEFRNAFPTPLKIITFLSPLSLMEILNLLLGIPQTVDLPNNISILGFWGDVYLFISWITLLIVMGYVVFVYKHRIIKVVKS